MFLSSLVVVLSLLVCYIAFSIVSLVGRYLLDKPNSRSSQFYLGGGGVALVLVVCLSSLTCLLPVWCRRVELVRIPFWFAYRCHRQFSGRLFTFHLYIVISSACHGNISFYWLLCMFPCFYSFFCYISNCSHKFVNFMDGLDGLVAGCMAVAITASSHWKHPSLWTSLAVFLASYFGIGVSQVFGDVEVLFLARFSPACCSRLPIDRGWLPPCEHSTAGWCLSLYSPPLTRRTTCVPGASSPFVSAFAPSAGLTPVYQAHALRPQLCWRWPCL